MGLDLFDSKDKAMESKIQSIIDFQFPFFNHITHNDMIDELISATDSLIDDAKAYKEWLNFLKQD